MNSFREEVSHVLDSMDKKVEDAICECDKRLIEISEGKSYKELSHALKCNRPFLPNVEYRSACHEQLFRLIAARQANEKIR
ncbi:TPA_asm: hypothetical protein GZV06_15320 [Listeria monocytogenes]|nr:hypothetical protein [Listeria monocytogenes]